MKNSISVIIISYNCKYDTLECVKSIITTCRDNIPEIIVVDNNSIDNTVDELRSSFPNIKIIQNLENRGYSFAINQGVASSSGEYLILTNADVIYLETTIYGLVDELTKNKSIGMVGPQQIFSDGSYQRSYGLYPSIKRGVYDVMFISSINQRLLKYKFQKDTVKNINVEYLDGAILCTSRTIFDELGGFDDSFFFFSEEVDFAYRLKLKGYDRVLIKKYKVIHHRGGSQENRGMNEESIDKLNRAEAKFILKYKSRKYMKLYFILRYIFFKEIGIINTLLNKKVEANNNLLYLSSIKKIRNETI